MHKGTKAHKDALSAFKAAEQSSMKRRGIYETYYDEGGDMRKRRISKEEFEKQMAEKEAMGEKPAVNLGGVGLDQGRVNEYVLTGDDINLLPESAQQGTYYGDDTQVTAPQMVKANPNYLRDSDSYKDAFQVTEKTDLGKVASRSKDYMDKVTGPLDFDRKNILIENEGIDRNDFQKFVSNLPMADRMKLLKSRSADLSKITKKSDLDRVIQAYVNRGGKVTKAPGQMSVASQTAEKDEFGKRTQGTR